MPLPQQLTTHEFPQDLDELNLNDAKDLTEQQLRYIYNNEEINRFLDIFSSVVTEVRSPESPSSQPAPSNPNSDLNNLNGPPITDYSKKRLNEDDNTLSRYFASWLLSLLPATATPTPDFTLGRLKVAVQRLYLAIAPVYGPFFSTLVYLATWQDRRRSAFYCTMYWLLWYNNLLLPTLFLRILYSLARRRVLPYPTIEELRERQREAQYADQLGEEVTARLSASSPLDMKEVRKLLRVVNRTLQSKLMIAVKGKASQDGLPTTANGTEHVARAKTPDSTVLDTQEDKMDADFKRNFLHTLGSIADLHERVKNIFIWRNPPSSLLYGQIMFCLFIVTLILPARYLAKLTYFLTGFCFWHVTPIFSVLPMSDRARIPPPFADVPTDADHAMALISQRVAAGLNVTPEGSRSQFTDGVPPSTPTQREIGSVKSRQGSATNNINWKKWGGRIATSKAWVENGRRVWNDEQTASIGSRLTTLLSPSSISMDGTYAFPARHNTGSGLITLTTTALYFTPLMSSNATTTIPADKIYRVKKAGMLEGLTICWIDNEQGSEITREDRFRWVGGRDDLFARLIGTTSQERKWVKV